MYAVIKGHEIIRENYETTKIVIAFNPLEEKFEIPDASILRNPRYIKNISDIFSPEINVLKFIQEFVENLQKHLDLDDTQINKIQNSIMKLKGLENYPFTTLQLSQSIDEEAVADVFVRINSQGKTLNQSDFILTLMSVFWEDGRKELEEFCRQTRIPNKHEASAFNYLIEPKPDKMLRVSVGLAFRRARLQYVYSILRGKDLDTGQFSEERRDAQFDKLKQAQENVIDITNWHEFLKAIQQAGYVRADYISSGNNLLYSYVFFLMGKIDYNLDLFTLRKLIARWYYMVSLTRRYTGSPETQMEMDLALFRNIESKEDFKSKIENLIYSQLTPDFWTLNLPLELATSSSRSPSLFSYYAALYNLNAKGLFSNLPVSALLQKGVRSKKSALERHHLFPKNYLYKNGVTSTRDTNQIANYALVEWSDNIDIKDLAPNDYMQKYESRFPRDENHDMYRLHALPKNWETMEYQDFLTERRNLMAQIIKEGFEAI